MKKVLIFGVVALFTAGIFATSCDEDNPISCAQKLVEVSSAASAYSSDPSDANCIIYKNALQDYINCDGIAQTDKATYQAIMEALPCYP